MCIYMQKKINLTRLFFLQIFHIKESCNLNGQDNFGPQLLNQNFARLGTCGEI